MKRLLLLPFLLLFISCTKNEIIPYEKAIRSLENQEKLNPSEFLAYKGSFAPDYKSIWVLDGSITNKALVTTYQDLVMNIRYVSEKNVVLGSELRSVQQFVRPGQTIHFKLRTFSFSQAKKIQIDIESAVAME